MIGLDTNVLVRYLTDDEPNQSARAAALIDGAAARGERMFVGQIVLCELVWVLEAAYGRPKGDLIRALEAVLQAAQLVVEDVALAHRALARYAEGKAGFADYVSAERSAAAGCEALATFDRNLLREPDVVEPERGVPAGG